VVGGHPHGALHLAGQDAGVATSERCNGVQGSSVLHRPEAWNSVGTQHAFTRSVELYDTVLEVARKRAQQRQHELLTGC
jgi:hypothetical protein